MHIAYRGRRANTQLTLNILAGKLIRWPVKYNPAGQGGRLQKSLAGTLPNRSLYNRVRKANLEGLEDNFEGHAASTSCVFVQLVLYIEETRQHDGSAPVFKRNYPIFTSHKWKS